MRANGGWIDLLAPTVLIDYLRGYWGAVELVDGLAGGGHNLAACCVSVAELYTGVNPAQRTKVDGLISGLEYYDISVAAAKEAGSYRHDYARRGIALSVADTLIAATAIDQGAILVTANPKDFPMEEIQLLEHP